MQTCARDGPRAGTCVSKSLINFGAGPNFNELPSCMQAALTRSKAGTQTAADDAVMGKLGSPYDPSASKCEGKPIIPYCQQSKYKSTDYCACQNVGVPNAVCIFEPCQGSSWAYKTTQQRATAANPAKLCPHEIVCQNIIAVGGKNNVTSAYQNSNCGGTIQKITSQIKLHPAIFVILLILVVFLAMSIASPGKKDKKGPPPDFDDGALPAFPATL